MKEKTCEWKRTDDGANEYYETECGGTQRFIDGGSISDNDYSYCPFCGCKIKTYEPPSAEDEREQRVRDGEIDTMGRVR